MQRIIATQASAKTGGCTFIAGDDPPASCAACDAPCHPGSPYCAEHHTLCYLAPGSRAEQRQMRAIEALAQAVGGRLGRELRAPPDDLLRRLDRIERAFSRDFCSRIVPTEAAMAATQRNGNGKNGARQAREDGPTAERLQHGPVERVDRPVADVAGHPSRPYRAVDTLLIMERRGSITAGMRQAGEDFRARFAVAQLDPLRAVDLAHLRVAETGPQRERDAPGLRIEAARRAVWSDIQAVGGIASPAGSCLWHVLGWQASLKEWAVEQGWSGRRVHPDTASGILIAALGALESHLEKPS